MGEQAKQEPGTKFDAGKPRTELLPWPALFEVAKVLTKGAEKYGDWNWRKGMSYSRLLGAATRHLGAWANGENLDQEFEISHLAHAACCLLFLLTFELDQVPGNNYDDRFSYQKSQNNDWQCQCCGTWFPPPRTEDYLCADCRRNMPK